MSSTADYAGDVPGEAAWNMLRDQPAAQLIDVRTAAEWAFVGLPDVSSLGREVHCVEWQVFPSMAPNPHFVQAVSESLRAVGADEASSLLFLCRSGARSRSAAIAMTRAGFAQCWNIAAGFEGDRDANGHRSRVNGWKFSGLPWRQN